MKIKYYLTEDDYIHFNLFHIKNSITAKRALNIQRYVIPIILLFITYFTSLLDDDLFKPLFITSIFTIIIWLVFYPKYFYYIFIRNVRKMIKEERNDGLLGEHSMILTEEGIVDTSSNRETKVTWSGIKSFKEDNENLYLYNSAVSAYILPKRGIDHLDKLKSYINSKLSSFEKNK